MEINTINKRLKSVTSGKKLHEAQILAFKGFLSSINSKF